MSIICPSVLSTTFNPFSYRSTFVGKVAYLCYEFVKPFAISIIAKALLPDDIKFVVYDGFSVFVDIEC